MSVNVRLPGSLRDATGGETRIEATGATLGAVVADLEHRFPALRGRILDERGALQSYVNVYIGDRDARQAGGADAPVADAAEVMIIPAMSGGADAGPVSGRPMVIDARGTLCPMPIVRLQKAIQDLPVGGLAELIATDPGSDPDVKAWGRETGNEIVAARRDGAEFRFVIRRMR